MKDGIELYTAEHYTDLDGEFYCCPEALEEIEIEVLNKLDFAEAIKKLQGNIK